MPRELREVVASQALACVQALAQEGSPFEMVREVLEMPAADAPAEEWACWLRFLAEVITCDQRADPERAPVIDFETRLPRARNLVPATRQEVEDLDKLDQLAAAGAGLPMTTDEQRALAAGLALLPRGEGL